eukprot:Rhum_TRINITY_DN14000_c4_g1::Rhum_TRINITY_DN14000_c4_g1_i1::g.67358::m.67358
MSLDLKLLVLEQYLVDLRVRQAARSQSTWVGVRDARDAFGHRHGGVRGHGRALCELRPKGLLLLLLRARRELLLVRRRRKRLLRELHVRLRLLLLLRLLRLRRSCRRDRSQRAGRLLATLCSRRRRCRILLLLLLLLELHAPRRRLRRRSPPQGARDGASVAARPNVTQRYDRGLCRGPARRAGGGQRGLDGVGLHRVLQLLHGQRRVQRTQHLDDVRHVARRNPDEHVELRRDPQTQQAGRRVQHFGDARDGHAAVDPCVTRHLVQRRVRDQDHPRLVRAARRDAEARRKRVHHGRLPVSAEQLLESAEFRRHGRGVHEPQRRRLRQGPRQAGLVS